MTEKPTTQLFAEDAYLSTAEAKVVAIGDGGHIVLDQTNFYATSGGQPGDSGLFERADGTSLTVETTVYASGGKTTILHKLAEGAAIPEVGETLTLHVDWKRRYNLMRMHTACHLLSVVCPLPITGAAVGEMESRVDFDMTDTADKAALTEAMMKIVNANHSVFTKWVDEAELDANPDLVKSKNVKPPRGLGRIRLIGIGENASIDSQPCGGTHVGETSEVGEIHIGKIEKKGRENRRMRIRFGPLPTQ
ncbi:MAG: alanyl-tRNA editing protein [Pseudomonadota bacterium]